MGVSGFIQMWVISLFSIPGTDVGEFPVQCTWYRFGWVACSVYLVQKWASSLFNIPGTDVGEFPVQYTWYRCRWLPSSIPGTEVGEFPVQYICMKMKEFGSRGHVPGVPPPPLDPPMPFSHFIVVKWPLKRIQNSRFWYLNLFLKAVFWLVVDSWACAAG